MQLLSRIRAKSEREITISIMPIRRAQSNFFKGLYDCVFVGTQDKQPYLDAGMTEGSFIVSNHINKLKIKAYTPDFLPPIKALGDVKGHVVAGEVGAIQAFVRSYPEISAASSVLPVESLQNAIKIVEEGRADVIVSFDLDMRVFMRDHPDMKGKYQASSFNLRENNESVVCKNTPTGAHIVSLVNDILANEPLIEGFTR
ncbi:hypothetical protein [Kordiimonas sp. SCSIO 12610]|uniref:hypothetical protein n=1 Tax=Kordiimonas sp. SCSIO 12610 TaxID=2829597 RepID=UPI00210D2AE3|nr:hypothetical protein [Kordiimonas sp. SCSIO 12610]UTW54244.1 hypothetical protein KFF44_10475 [Kordiimonas sp. SCSIO 12610]